METKQKNRPEAAQKRSRPDSPEKKPVKKRPEGAAPASAQQKNNAVRTESAQRTAAKKRAPEPKAKSRTRPEKKPEGKAAPVKKATVKRSRPKQEPDVPNKKRAYGNSKPKKRSALTLMAQDVKEKSQTHKKKKHSSSRPKQPTPAVIYTEPRSFNRNRFLIQMLTVLAVVVACVLALSVFFKVETITVTGADVYSAWAVQEASGIEQGDNLLTFSHARAGAQIMANLPYVESVRFGIKLPDTVNIIIEEAEVVYGIKDTVGQWWLMSSTGRIVEQVDAGVAKNYTQILGVTLESPAVNLQALAAEASPTETNASGEFIPVTVTGALRLNTAMQILKALEANDIVGEAASVDVTRIEDIILWYGTRYQVNLGDSTRLDYKIACMNDAILQMSDYQSGILDISFTNWLDQVGYTPFS